MRFGIDTFIFRRFSNGGDEEYFDTEFLLDKEIIASIILKENINDSDDDDDDDDVNSSPKECNK